MKKILVPVLGFAVIFPFIHSALAQVNTSCDDRIRGGVSQICTDAHTYQVLTCKIADEAACDIMDHEMIAKRNGCYDNFDKQFNPPGGGNACYVTFGSDFLQKNPYNGSPEVCTDEQIKFATQCNEELQRMSDEYYKCRVNDVWKVFETKQCDMKSRCIQKDLPAVVKGPNGGLIPRRFDTCVAEDTNEDIIPATREPDGSATPPPTTSPTAQSTSQSTPIDFSDIIFNGKIYTPSFLNKIPTADLTIEPRADAKPDASWAFTPQFKVDGDKALPFDITNVKIFGAEESKTTFTTQKDTGATSKTMPISLDEYVNSSVTDVQFDNFAVNIPKESEAPLVIIYADQPTPIGLYQSFDSTEIKHGGFDPDDSQTPTPHTVVEIAPGSKFQSLAMELTAASEALTAARLNAFVHSPGATVEQEEKMMAETENALKHFDDTLRQFMQESGISTTKVNVTEIIGKEHVKVAGSRETVTVPVSPTFVTALDRHTDYTFAYDAKTKITSVEVYDGNVDVVDLNTGNILAKLVSSYGSPIARADVAADRTVVIKTAIPKSEWPAFVATHSQKPASHSNLWLWAVIMILLGGGFWIYEKGILKKLISHNNTL